MSALSIASVRGPSAKGPVHVPGVWLGNQLCDALANASVQATQPTGHAALDAQLPGGGWPVGALTEVLQAEPSRQAWQLLQPALVQATAARPGAVVLVSPPFEPFAPALLAAGLAPDRLCKVQPEPAQAGHPRRAWADAGASRAAGHARRHSAGSAALWAAEQALRCRDVLAVVAWLPQALPEQLRRLQLAAAQMGQLLWVLRPASARQQASPAPLRLWLQSDAAAPLTMQVQVLKRRGPPLAQPVVLPGCSARLAQVLAAAVARGRQRRGQAAPVAAPGRGTDGLTGVVHALDRVAVPAAL